MEINLIEKALTDASKHRIAIDNLLEPYLSGLGEASSSEEEEVEIPSEAAASYQTSLKALSTNLDQVAEWLDSCITKVISNKVNDLLYKPSFLQRLGAFLNLKTVRADHEEETVYTETPIAQRQGFVRKTLNDLFSVAPQKIRLPDTWTKTFRAKIENLLIEFLVEPLLAIQAQLNNGINPLEQVISSQSLEAPLKTTMLDDNNVDDKLTIESAKLLAKMCSTVPEETYIDGLVNIWKKKIKLKESIGLGQFFNSLRLIPYNASRYLVQFASQELSKVVKADIAEDIEYQSQILELMARVEEIDYNPKLVQDLISIWNQIDPNDENRIFLLKILLAIKDLPQYQDSYNLVLKALQDAVPAADPVLANVQLNMATILIRSDNNANSAMSSDVNEKLKRFKSIESSFDVDLDILNKDLKFLDSIFAPIDNLYQDYFYEEKENQNYTLLTKEDFPAEIRKSQSQASNYDQQRLDYAAILMDLLSKISEKEDEAKVARKLIRMSILRLGEYSLAKVFDELESENSLRILNYFWGYEHGRIVLDHFIAKNKEKFQKLNFGEINLNRLVQKDSSYNLAWYLVDKGLRIAV